jgi:hypothetical protein
MAYHPRDKEEGVETAEQTTARSTSFLAHDEGEITEEARNIERYGDVGEGDEQ